MIDTYEVQVHMVHLEDGVYIRWLEDVWYKADNVKGCDQLVSKELAGDLEEIFQKERPDFKEGLNCFGS